MKAAEDAKLEETAALSDDDDLIPQVLNLGNLNYL